MRPIDADALKVKFCNHCDERDCKPDATDTVYGCVIADTIDSMPTIEAEPVKHGRWIDHEKLIGIFGTLCDYMVDNGRCDVFCPYADTKDANDECEAWRTIQKFRREGRNAGLRGIL